MEVPRNNTATKNKKKKHKKKYGKKGNRISPYYKQPYVLKDDLTSRTSEFEYGLTDT